MSCRARHLRLPCYKLGCVSRIRIDPDIRMSQLRIGLPSTRKRLKCTLSGAVRKRFQRRASRVAHLNNHIISMLLVFFLLFLKVVLSDLQFSQGVVFFCWAASILLQYACTSFLSYTHSLGICTHTYTVTRASVTLARTHDPMLLSWQVFVPPFPWLNFPFPCFLSFCYGYFVKKKKKKKKKFKGGSSGCPGALWRRVNGASGYPDVTAHALCGFLRLESGFFFFFSQLQKLSFALFLSFNSTIWFKSFPHSFVKFESLFTCIDRTNFQQIHAI